MRAALLLTAGLAACAPVRVERPVGPAYTRAGVDGRTTAELAALFLPPADRADVERHTLLEVFGPGSILSGIHFYVRPRPLDSEICRRDIIYANFDPVDWTGKARTAGDKPVRLGSVSRHSDIALAPGCEQRPGRRFANVGFRRLPSSPPFTNDDGIAVLRRLAGAQAAARGREALPFRLSCAILQRHLAMTCPSDPRTLLAGLPLHGAISIDRAPFRPNTLCGHPQAETGDSVEIDPGDSEGGVWEVRLRDMGTDHAAITMSWQLARHRVRC